MFQENSEQKTSINHKWKLWKKSESEKNSWKIELFQEILRTKIISENLKKSKSEKPSWKIELLQENSEKNKYKSQVGILKKSKSDKIFLKYNFKKT